MNVFIDVILSLAPFLLCAAFGGVIVYAVENIAPWIEETIKWNARGRKFKRQMKKGDFGYLHDNDRSNKKRRG